MATQVIHAVVETLAELLLNGHVVTLDVAFAVEFGVQPGHV